MTNEEKQILFKDLCARLPYHVRVKVWLEYGDTEEGPLDLQHNYGDVLRDSFYYKKIKKIKPYLRPMSSMTEEEKKKVHYFVESHKLGNCSRSGAISDYLNSIHIDYRGLIEKGLALEAPEGMYKTKTE